MDFKHKISKMIRALPLVLLLSTQLACGDILTRFRVQAGEGSAVDATASPAETTEDPEECRNSFDSYEDTYLQGVTEHFIIYNNTALSDCVAICCSKSRLDCKSFTYSAVLEMCIIMNITRFHEGARMTKTSIFRHYHRVVPGDNTTALPESTTFTSPVATNETTPDPTADAIAATLEPKTTSTASTTDSSTETPAKTTTLSTSARPTTVSSTASSTVRPSKPASSAQTATSSGATSSATSSAASSTAATVAPSASFGTGEGSGSTSSPAVDTAPSETVKILPDTTTTVVTTTQSVATPRSLANLGSTEAIIGGALTTSPDLCPKECKNGGKCEWVVTEKDEEKNINYASSQCVCLEGFEGKQCEQRTALKAGVPSYIIAVAVLGSIILILFLTVVIIYALYRSRTGKYRVREQRDRWNKTTARRTQSFNSMNQRSPVGSELSVPGSVNSTTTRSTATTV